MKLLCILVAITVIGSLAAVTVNVDTSKARDLANFGSTVKRELEKWYPYLSNKTRSPSFEEVQTIPIYFDPDYTGVAYAQGGKIVGAVNYYRNNQGDVGSMIHEMMHVIQQYRNGPGWLVEGIADYWRYYHYEKRILAKPTNANNYTQGYGITAYFLNWVQVKKGDMLYWLNKDCREGTYKDTIWPRLLRKEVLQLWNEMLDDRSAT